MSNSSNLCEKQHRSPFFDNSLTLLSAFLGIFFAYIVQLSYTIFSSSAELSSILVVYKALDYFGDAEVMINQAVSISNENLMLVVISLFTFALFATIFYYCTENIKKSSKISTIKKIILSIILLLVIGTWLVEPLIVLFSSYNQPTLVYGLGYDAIPSSDAARASYLYTELDHFQLMSVSFNFSVRNILLANSVLIASLVLLKLSDWNKTKAFRFIQLFLTILPIIVYFVCWFIFPFSYDYYIGGFGTTDYPREGAIYISGIGDIYLGEIVHSPVLYGILEHSSKLFLLLWMLCIVIILIPLLINLIKRLHNSENFVKLCCRRVVQSNPCCHLTTTCSLTSNSLFYSL